MDMEITKDSIIGDVIDAYPELAEIFFSFGMHCTSCPVARAESIEQAGEMHGIDVNELVDALCQAQTLLK